MRIAGLVIILFGLIFPMLSLAQEGLPAGFQYIFPGPGTKYVHPNSTIILRFRNISPKNVTNLSTCIKVSGGKSGPLSGKTIIASDNRTIIFTPEKSYKLGGKVYVIIEAQLSEFNSNAIQPLKYEFTVLEKEVSKGYMADEKSSNFPVLKNANAVKPGIMPNGVSVPADFPQVNIALSNNPSSYYFFVNTMIVPYYNIIFNTLGEPVWYRRTSKMSEDFRVQSNGWITMQMREGNDEPDWGHIAFTQNFEYIKSFRATNGYSSDMHEFFMLPDSGYFLIGKRDTEVDMSQFVTDGKPDAIVTETCIQEFTADDQLIFIWRAWDHFDIVDLELADLTSSHIRFPHMNAIFTDYDGHILLSSRHLSEISKIHRQTGEFIWRMSGIPDSPNNEFQFVDDPLNGFRNQHAIRSLGNNRYTLLDNGNSHTPPVSRAVEYEIDTTQMTATLVWEYRNDLNTRIARFMGNAQRLSNGNTHINWAVSNSPQIAIEVTPEGEKVFEMWYENGANCYRSFRHPWEGKCPAPYLILEPQIDNLTLIFNKFGDDSVDYYNIYGGTAPNPSTLIDTSQSTLKQLSGLVNGLHYYFRVRAVDMNGLESDFSNEEKIYVNITQPGTNLIINGDFSNDLNAWEWEVDTQASAEVQIVDGVCNFVIQNGGNKFQDLRLIQKNIPLLMGQNYLFEFDAWSDGTRIVDIFIGADHSPFSDYGRISFTALHSELKHYTYSFEMTEPTDINTRVVINAGSTAENIYMDNISLKMDVSTGIDDGSMTAGGFMLFPNYPNPFSSVTHIEYYIPETSFVSLSIYNALGQKVEDYILEEQISGRYSREIQLSKYDSGIYVYSLEAKAVRSAKLFQKTNRMILLK